MRVAIIPARFQSTRFPGKVLADLGLHKIRLMIHSDRRIAAIEAFGIEIVERVPIPRPNG